MLGSHCCWILVNVWGVADILPCNMFAIHSCNEEVVFLTLRYIQRLHALMFLDMHAAEPALTHSVTVLMPGFQPSSSTWDCMAIAKDKDTILFKQDILPCKLRTVKVIHDMIFLSGYIGVGKNRFTTRHSCACRQEAVLWRPPPGLEPELTPPAPVPPAPNVPALGSVGSAKHSTGDARFRDHHWPLQHKSQEISPPSDSLIPLLHLDCGRECFDWFCHSWMDVFKDE